jgi:transcriptional regulator with XRE-family HTH domain
MSTIEYGAPVPQLRLGGPVETRAARRPLHQLGLVRRREGLSRRTMARRLNVDIGRVKLQEKEDTDMWLSTLYEWQRALDVPVSELLVDCDDPLSAPVLKRAQMLRLMKTAKAMLERAHQPSIRRLAQMLVEQLLEIMPELEDVNPWHIVGQRRTQAELGQAAERGRGIDWFREAAGY